MRKKILALAVGLAVVLAAAEVLLGIRLADGTFQGAPVPPFGVPTPEIRESLARRAVQAREQPGSYGPLIGWSARYGWVGVPGVVSTEGRELTRNSRGARGAREIEAKAAGRIRVLCFGESFTYGAEVADGEDWPAGLERRDERLEVWNFGVNAWGTDQALLRFRELARELEPDVVLLGLLTENICRNVNRFRQMYQPRDALALVKPRFVLTDGALELVPIPYATEAEFLDVAARGELRDELREHEWWTGDEPLVPGSNLARAWAARRARARRLPARLWMDPGGEPYRVTLALAEAFQREAHALGADAAVVIFQPESDHGHYGPAETVEYLRGFRADLEARGVRYIDTYRTIEERRAAGSRCYLTSHHDAAGNEAIAGRIQEYLRATVAALR